MSSKSTIVWLLVAIALGAAALLLMRTNTGSAGQGLKIGDRLIAIDPAAVTSVDVRHPDGGSETLSRAGSMEWSMVVRPSGTAAGQPRPSWPVVSSRVQALLRHLGDATVRALPDKSATIGDRAVEVEIKLAGEAPPVKLRLSDQSVAGKSLVEVEQMAETGSTRPTTARAVVDDSLHQIFRDHAPREWRDRQALHGLGLDVSRVALTNDRDVKLALGKVDGAWSVREPVSAPADPAVIQRLLSSLASVQIVDFLDQGVADAGTRLDKPAAVVTIETDRREPDPAAAARRLEVGGASDAAGTRLFARIDQERTVVIDARAVADLRLEPTTFIWPFPTRLVATDIGTVALEPVSTGGATPEGSAQAVVFRRQLDKWMQIRTDGQSVQLPAAETAPVEALMAFLCGPGPAAATGATAAAPAGPMSIALAPAPAHKVLGRLTLLSLSGAPVEAIEVASHQAGMVTLKTGPVYRTWSLDRVPSRLAEFVQLALIPKVAPGQADATPQPSK